ASNRARAFALGARMRKPRCARRCCNISRRRARRMAEHSQWPAWSGREAHMAKDASHDLNSGISRRTLVRAGLGAIPAPAGARAVLRVIPANAQSRVIKIGHVSPKTGPLAGFGEADGFILEQVRGILSKGLQSGGRTYQVQIISKDSQSSGSRAAEVASELIL